MMAGNEVTVLAGSLKGMAGTIRGTSEISVDCFRVRVGGKTFHLHRSALRRLPHRDHCPTHSLPLERVRVGNSFGTKVTYDRCPLGSCGYVTRPPHNAFSGAAGRRWNGSKWEYHSEVAANG